MTCKWLLIYFLLRWHFDDVEWAWDWKLNKIPFTFFQLWFSFSFWSYAKWELEDYIKEWRKSENVEEVDKFHIESGWDGKYSHFLFFNRNKFESSIEKKMKMFHFPFCSFSNFFFFRRFFLFIVPFFHKLQK